MNFFNHIEITWTWAMLQERIWQTRSTYLHRMLINDNDHSFKQARKYYRLKIGCRIALMTKSHP